VRLQVWWWTEKENENKKVRKGRPSVEGTWGPDMGFVPMPVGITTRVKPQTVYMKGATVIQPEESDSGCAWGLGAELAEALWSGGDPLPYRVPGEILRAFAHSGSEPEEVDSRVTENSRLVLIPRPMPQDLVIRSRAGLFSEPAESLEVSVAAKLDDAEVDESLWAIGGMSAEMIQARKGLRRGLHFWWLKALKRGVHMDSE
jgi:hypothetical protein